MNIFIFVAESSLSAAGNEQNLTFMTHNLQIEYACQKDLKQILELQKQCFLSEASIYKDYSITPLHQDIKAITEEFNNGVIFKAVIQDKIIGSVRGTGKKNTCYIAKLIVHDDFQNRGIGARLLAHIEEHFSACNRYELYTGYKSEKNIFLYKKSGYTEFRREKINDIMTMVYMEKIKKSCS